MTNDESLVALGISKNDKNEKVITSTAITDIQKEFFKKSHELVFSQLSFSPVEHDILALLLSRLHKDHWQDFISGKSPTSPNYQFNSDILSEWFSVKKDDLYVTLNKPAERLSEKAIGVRNGNSFDFIPLFQRITYKNGVLTVKPNYELMNQYLGISQGHAQISHSCFRKIRSEYAKRLYSMLCRFKTFETELHAQTIEELHAFFGLLNKQGKLEKTTYEKNSYFINRIIKPAIAEIDAKEPEIFFQTDEKTGNKGFAFIKQGRKVTGIKFLFNWQSIVEKNCSNNMPKLSYDDALIAFVDVMEKRRIPNGLEIENLKKYLVQIGSEGYELNSGFFNNLKEIDEINS